MASNFPTALDIPQPSAILGSEYTLPVTPEQLTDTGRLLIRSFGIQTVKTLIYRAGMPTPTNKDITDKKSLLNTPVFSSLEIEGGRYQDYDGKILRYPSVSIDTCIFTVSQQKNIVTTEIAGGNGTIKEYIGLGDFQINIKGLIVGRNGQYPKDTSVVGKGRSGTGELLAALNARTELGINSDFLQLFNIYQVVVSYYSFPQTEGGQSIQAFEINALSDTPTQLNIKK